VYECGLTSYGSGQGQLAPCEHGSIKEGEFLSCVVFKNSALWNQLIVELSIVPIFERKQLSFNRRDFETMIPSEQNPGKYLHKHKSATLVLCMHQGMGSQILILTYLLTSLLTELSPS
jgi:hypothetical protein